MVAELTKARLRVLEKQSVERVNPELSSGVVVQFKTVPQKTVTWDDKQNDEHHNRREALVRFMKAGTKVILHYRMMKRLAKIKELLSPYPTREAVKKMVQ